MSKIKVEPWKRPRLSDEGLMAIMNPGGRGLVCVAGVCPSPGCCCRDIIMRVIPIDFRVKAVSIDGVKVTFTSLPIGGLGPAEDMESAVNARLITDTGELLLEPATLVDPQADALLEPLREALDGELLDDFARFCGRLKGEQADSDDACSSAHDEDWLPGDTLGFAMVYNTPRFDSFREGEMIWEVADFYCTDPDSDCNEVTVAFLDSEGDGDGDAAGAVKLDLSTGEVSFEHETEDQTLVPQLWRRFIERHRGVSLLEDRLEKMKAFGETLIEAQGTRPPGEKGNSERPPASSARSPSSASTPKIGRNDPCSCGSGKKYKKCCLAGAS